MSIFGGRSVVLLTYAALTIHGIASGGSGFLLLFALQLDLLRLIVLYGTRPARVRRSGQPDTITVLVSSVPLIIINCMLANSLGEALGEYPDGDKFLVGAKKVWGTAMVVLTIGYVCAIALDRILFRKDAAFWEGVVSRMAIKTTVLGFLGYIGFGLLLWLGRENSHWVVPCLALARIALEFVLQPDQEPLASNAKH